MRCSAQRCVYSLTAYDWERLTRYACTVAHFERLARCTTTLKFCRFGTTVLVVSRSAPLSLATFHECLESFGYRISWGVLALDLN